MRICIFGAGAIGGMIGSLLKYNKIDVTLIARGEHYNEIKKNGLVFKSKEYNLDMVFKKDRPFLILTDSTNMDFGSGLNMPGSGSDLKLNFSDSIDFNLDSYHSIILNSN